MADRRFEYLSCETCGGPVQVRYGFNQRRFVESLTPEIERENDMLRAKLSGAERRIEELKKKLDGR